MTLRHYTPEMLDKLALRVFDTAAAIRGMAAEIRQSDIDGIEVHDKKPLEWCDSLEIWVEKTAGLLPAQIRANKYRKKNAK